MLSPRHRPFHRSYCSFPASEHASLANHSVQSGKSIPRTQGKAYVFTITDSSQNTRLRNSPRNQAYCPGKYSSYGSCQQLSQSLDFPPTRPRHPCRNGEQPAYLQNYFSQQILGFHQLRLRADRLAPPTQNQRTDFSFRVRPQQRHNSIGDSLSASEEGSFVKPSSSFSSF